jgi:translation initiation factor IF-2
MGGEVQDVEVSALKGTNLDGLLEAILLQAELLDLKANPDRTAEGVVIEAKLDKRPRFGRDRAGSGRHAEDRRHPRRWRQWGRVRALVNDRGEQVKSEAEPSLPVEILGLNGTPQAGDRFAVVENEAAPARSPSTASAGPREGSRPPERFARFARADDGPAAG